MKCRVCGKELSTQQSIERRAGPVCFARMTAGGDQLELEFPKERTWFGLENIKEQHDRIKRILNRRSVVTDVG